MSSTYLNMLQYYSAGETDLYNLNQKEILQEQAKLLSEVKSFVNYLECSGIHTILLMKQIHIQSLAMGWRVQGSNPGHGKIFHTCLDQLCGPPSLLHNGYQVSFPSIKQQKCGIDHPTLSGAQVKERVELYLYSPSGPA